MYDNTHQLSGETVSQRSIERARRNATVATWTGAGCRGCFLPIFAGELALDLPSGEPAHAKCLENVSHLNWYGRK